MGGEELSALVIGMISLTFLTGVLDWVIQRNRK